MSALTVVKVIHNFTSNFWVVSRNWNNKVEKYQYSCRFKHYELFCQYAIKIELFNVLNKQFIQINEQRNVCFKTNLSHWVLYHHQAS